MPMLFLGDVASHTPACSAVFRRSLQQAGDIFDGHRVVANLEGLISDDALTTRTPVLYNHSSVVSALRDIDTAAVSLANNHTLDIPEQLEPTRSLLDANGMGYCGAGRNRLEAEQPARFTVDGKPVLMLACCWDVLMQHQINREGVCYVNPLRPKRMLEVVRQIGERVPEAVLVISMHWNFDLETRPFPMYRQLARDLIDAGASAVIGSHSHCVQGGERHGDGIIVYGLGNFFIPWFTFINGTIHFPDFSREELALAWDPATGEAVCHWFEYDYGNGAHRLVHRDSAPFEADPRLRELSPYAGMSTDEYLQWFKTARRKRRLMPVYRDYTHRLRNRSIDTYLRYRIRLARLLARWRVREWNN